MAKKKETYTGSNFAVTWNDKDKDPFAFQLTTMEGRARYPYLLEPQVHEQYSPNGVYKCDLIVPKEDIAELMDFVDEMVEKHFNEVYNAAKAKDKKKLVKHLPFEDEYDEADEPTGNVILKTKPMDAQVKSKKTGDIINLSPDVFDKKGKAWDMDNPVWGGSTVALALKCYPYHVIANGLVGITMRLQAVQVIKTVASSKTADSFGFGSHAEDDDDDTGQDDTPADTNDDEGNGDF